MNKISPDEPVYVISVAARLVGLHEQTLRIYEKKGLVVPKRTDKKTRLYSMNDLKKLRLIKLLTQKRGLNLAGVKMILEMIDDIDRALREFEEELENLL
ncbi:MAG: MerR family transcriptional regulator [Candidatus Hydrothermae bacterium]|nr:MerR family transcriptional regulator [Candidatus Hydrothermae bacterium]